MRGGMADDGKNHTDNTQKFQIGTPDFSFTGKTRQLFFVSDISAVAMSCPRDHLPSIYGLKAK